MAKKLTRLLSLVLAVLMAFSMAACKGSKQENTSSKKQTSSAAPAPSDPETPDNPDDSADNEEPVEDEDPQNWDNTGDIDNPEIGNTLPESYYETHSVLKDDDFDNDDFPEIPEDPTDPDDPDNPELRTSPIQMAGTAKATNERVMNVDVNKTVFKNYNGLGTNCFPTGLMEESLTKTEYNEVYMELDQKRFRTMNGKSFRMWFQVDWITTTDESDPTRDDYENNVDYKNYINGVYDFDSTRMKAVYPFLDMWKASNASVALNYGWKASTVIQKWFCFPGISDPQGSAPYDLDAYAKSCAALMYELRKNRGYTNIDQLTFYNEPGQGYDYITYVPDKAYWVIMIKKVNEELTKLGIRDELTVWSCEENSMNWTHHEFTDYIKKNGSQYIDLYACHFYYGTYAQEDDYGYAFPFFCWLHNYYNEHPVYMTEYYAGAYGNLDKAADGLSERTVWRDWNDSTASYLIATANSGVNGMLKWGFTANCLPNPQNFNPASGYPASWWTPTDDQHIDGVNVSFYDESLITNYIDSGSDVLMIDWTGNDIRGAAFKSPSGDYTIVVDAKGSANATKGTKYEVKDTVQRNLTINLKNNKKSLKFYKYHFDPDELLVKDGVDMCSAKNQHATVLQAEKTMAVTSKLTDVIGKEYGMYVYTTKKPVKQVEIETDSVRIVTKAGEVKNFAAKTIDCDASDEIVWSISKSITQNGNPGTLDANGKYTAAANAAEGDKIAIRASLKSNPNIFDVVIVQINK